MAQPRAARVTHEVARGRTSDSSLSLCRSAVWCLLLFPPLPRLLNSGGLPPASSSRSLPDHPALAPPTAISSAVPLLLEGNIAGNGSRASPRLPCPRRLPPVRLPHRRASPIMAAAETVAAVVLVGFDHRAVSLPPRPPQPPALSTYPPPCPAPPRSPARRHPCPQNSAGLEVPDASCTWPTGPPLYPMPPRIAML